MTFSRTARLTTFHYLRVGITSLTARYAGLSKKAAFRIYLGIRRPIAIAPTNPNTVEL